MNRVLVTGATGFVGRSLIPVLLKAGYTVRVALRTLSQMFDQLHVEKIVIGNIELKTDWKDALQDVDVVIHLAGRSHVMREFSQDPLHAYRMVNMEGTKYLAREAVRHGIKRFIYASSIKVHGENTSFDPETQTWQALTESSPIAPCDPYAQSKWEAEQVLQSIAKDSNMETIILRFPLIYGPYVEANFLRLLYLVQRNPFWPLKSIRNRRSLIYVGNLIDAICKIVGLAKVPSKVYLVSDNESISIGQLIESMAEILDRKIYLFPMPENVLNKIFKVANKSSLRDRLLGSLKISNELIQRDLEWKPPYRFLDGLEQTIQWYQGVENLGAEERI